MVIDSYNKLRGGYYTPTNISDFIVKWISLGKTDSILEPSCGDGSFLASIRRFYTAEKEPMVTAVELDPVEALKARRYGFDVIQGDFFSYYKQSIDSKKSYDAIIGNPPFIRYQNFDERYRAAAFELMEKHGFNPTRLMNIWLPFLLLCCEALSSDGRIGMVVPAELFQVGYAAEARNYLRNCFDRLTLMTFRKPVFSGIQQEVILLLGEKRSSARGIRFLEFEDEEELKRDGLTRIGHAETKEFSHNADKWVKYFLSDKELSIIEKLDSDSRIFTMTDLCKLNVGVVSGEKDFFISDWNSVTKYGIQDDVVPVISMAEQVKGLFISENDFQKLKEGGKKVFMFMPGDKPPDELSVNARAYVKLGEDKCFNRNYKCRIRKRWYSVPVSWKADAFITCKANLYPRMVLNPINAMVTDNFHKVKFKDGVNGKAVVPAFLNVYTLLLCEMLGQSYGGGVLTLTPGEMRRVRIPVPRAGQLDIRKIDVLQREGRYKEILSYTDKALLYDSLGLTEMEISLLHSGWDKLRSRRLARKYKNQIMP